MLKQLRIPVANRSRLALTATPCSMQPAYVSRGVATALDVLKRKNFRQSTLMIPASTTMREAAAKLSAVNGSTALLVTGDDRKTILGLLTVADVLRALRADQPAAQSLERCVKDFMTPSTSIVYGHPGDSLISLSVLMTEGGKSHLPIYDKGEVLGVVTINDIVKITLENVRGGKTSAVQSVMPRRGLGAETRIAARSPATGGAGKAVTLHMVAGFSSLPRQQRSPAPVEDAFFSAHVRWPPGPDDAPNSGGAGGGIVSYIGVADGVGSWHARGVDPRLYAQRLMERSSEAVWRAAVAGAPPPSPQQVLTSAWEATNGEGVVGSATAVVLMLDGAQNQLIVHGVGDCGVILLRDTVLDRVGSLLRGGTASGIRGGWRVSARATQQLKAFNQPYQLGFAPGQEGRFETPWQGETLVLPVQPGDLVIAASDGLFDNLDETDILAIVEEWSKKQTQAQPQQPQGVAGSPAAADSSTTDGAASAPSEPQAALLLDGDSDSAGDLARMLAHRAAQLSVDRSRDGPFARLAKECDILWTKGGRPDDVTVAVARVGTAGPTATLDGTVAAARRGSLRLASSISALQLSYDDPTVTGNVSHAVATAQCGEDATLRVLPRLSALQAEAREVELAERRIRATVGAPPADAAPDAAERAADAPNATSTAALAAPVAAQASNPASASPESVKSARKPRAKKESFGDKGNTSPDPGRVAGATAASNGGKKKKVAAVTKSTSATEA